MANQYKRLSALDDLAVVRDTNQVLMVLPDNDGTQGTNDSLAVVEMDDFKDYLLEETNTALEQTGVTLAAQAATLVSQGETLSGLTQAVGSSSKNKIINGNFDIWQRGGAQPMTAGAAYYLADRWATQAVGSSVQTTRQTFGSADLFDTAVPNATYYQRVAFIPATEAGSFAQSRHSVEDVRTLAGRTVTLSFYARCVGEASRPIGITCTQSFDDTGTVADIAVFNSVIAVTLDWKRYTVTFEMPSVFGQTLPEINRSCLKLFFAYHAAAGNSTFGDQLALATAGTIDIAQVQLEEGATATAFEEIPYADEEARCMRYSRVMTFNSGGAISVATCHTAGQALATLSLPTSMRIRPGVTTLGNVKAWPMSNTSAPPISVSAVTSNSIAFILDATGAAQFTCGYMASASSPFTVIVDADF